MTHPPLYRPMRNMPVRTKNQREADQFDLHLFRLIGTAEAAHDAVPASSDARRKWQTALGMLRGARVPVRMMMHEDDRK